ncbi:MAG: cell division protein ZapA [Desulfonatronovibrionaceae bacterium]
MPSYNISVLGLDVYFKTNAGSERIDRASGLIEDRFRKLDQRGRNLSKEKLLVFLALGLADDYLQTKESLDHVQERLNSLLDRLEESGE